MDKATQNNEEERKEEAKSKKYINEQVNSHPEDQMGGNKSAEEKLNAS